MVGHVGVGIILSISFLLAFDLVLFHVHVKKFLLFQFMVQKLRQVSVHSSYSNIVC